MTELHDALRRAVAGAALAVLLATPAMAEDQAPASDKAGEPPAPQNVETLPAGIASGILGKKIRDVAGVDMGMVTDVLVDRGGMPVAAVIDFGGFLGVGSRKIAIDWLLLQFNPTDDKGGIVLSLNRAQIQAAPEYKPSAKIVQMVGPPAAEGASTEPSKSE